MGVHPHAPMKGVQSPCPLCLCPCSARRTTGPSRPRRGEPPRSGAGCRAWTRRSSTTRLRPAPPGARRGEPACALAIVLWRATRTGRERGCALCTRFCASGGVSVRLAFTSARRYFRGIPPSCQSRRGYRSPGYMLPPDGRGYDKQGGYIKPHIDGKVRGFGSNLLKWARA